MFKNNVSGWWWPKSNSSASSKNKCEVLKKSAQGTKRTKNSGCLFSKHFVTFRELETLEYTCELPGFKSIWTSNILMTQFSAFLLLKRQLVNIFNLIHHVISNAAKQMLFDVNEIFCRLYFPTVINIVVYWVRYSSFTARFSFHSNNFINHFSSHHFRVQWKLSRHILFCFTNSMINGKSCFQNYELAQMLNSIN